MLLVTKIWEQRKLGEISETYSGGTPKVSIKSFYNKKEIPFIRSSDIHKNTTELYITKEGLEESSAKLVSKGQILYALYGATSGEVDISKIDGAINQAILAINTHDNINYFIMLFLNKNKDKIIKKYIQGGQGNLSAKIVKNININITSKKEEKEISTFIKKFEKIFTLYERKFKLLSRVKKYFLDNLFAEKEYPNLRFKGFTNTWEKIKLKDTQTTLTDGNYANLYPKPTDMTDADKGIPFLTGGNLKDGILDLKNAKYITKEKHSQLRSGHLEEDDIVIAVRGSLGELGYVTKQNIDWNINSQLAIIRTSKNELIGNFLLYFFLSSKGKSKLLSRQTGTALKQLPLQQLKTIVIPKTLLLEQQKISNILKTIDKTISFYKDKQQHLAEIKNTLLNTMFI